MNKKLLVVVLLLLYLLPWNLAAEDRKEPPRRVGIGADIRLGLPSCIDYWQPIADHLSKSIPECRFVIVPIASEQDLIRALNAGSINIMALDPAMELMAEDRFGSVPVATIVESSPGQTIVTPSFDACTGAVIRRADRSDLRNIRDLRNAKVSAVKPWSLTGWLAQWGLFKKDGITPQQDFKQVVFEGTDGQVVKSVLQGTADVGVMDANILFQMLKNQRIADESLYVFDQRGRAVPLRSGLFLASTPKYPGRLLSKTAATSDELARRVADALIGSTQRTALNDMPLQVQWTNPSNYSKVRRLLQTLLGPQFAYSNGYSVPRIHPAWLFPVKIVLAAIGVLAVIFVLLRKQFDRRENVLDEQLNTTRKELMEARAEKQRLDAILAIAGCGIDVVDDDDQIVYADPAMERRYGEWRGKKCYEYFGDADEPCVGCRRPGPLDERTPTVTDRDGRQWTIDNDADAKPYGPEGESTPMIGVPFHDEGGRWLYARIHLPAVVYADLNAKATSP